MSAPKQCFCACCIIEKRRERILNYPFGLIMPRATVAVAMKSIVMFEESTHFKYRQDLSFITLLRRGGTPGVSQEARSLPASKALRSGADEPTSGIGFCSTSLLLSSITLRIMATCASWPRRYQAYCPFMFALMAGSRKPCGRINATKEGSRFR